MVLDDLTGSRKIGQQNKNGQFGRKGKIKLIIGDT